MYPMEDFSDQKILKSRYHSDDIKKSFFGHNFLRYIIKESGLNFEKLFREDLDETEGDKVFLQVECVRERNPVVRIQSISS